MGEAMEVQNRGEYEKSLYFTVNYILYLKLYVKSLGNIMYSMETINNIALHMRKMLRVSLKNSHHKKKIV